MCLHAGIGWSRREQPGWFLPVLGRGRREERGRCGLRGSINFIRFITTPSLFYINGHPSSTRTSTPPVLPLRIRFDFETIDYNGALFGR
jgi:hypothetical protein